VSCKFSPSLSFSQFSAPLPDPFPSVSFRTLDFNFRPGPDAIEKEQIEEQKRMEEAQRALAMTTKQEATDWSVQAVVDEDELFK
jgi:hypothetical protein